MPHAPTRHPVDTAPDDAGADLTSRKIVAGLAAVGVAETAYLSYSKLAAAPVMCASQACGGVLNSAYASVAGVRRVLPGVLRAVRGSAVLTLTNAAVLRAWKAEARRRASSAPAPRLFAAGALFLAETDVAMAGASSRLRRPRSPRPRRGRRPRLHAAGRHEAVHRAVRGPRGPPQAKGAKM
ncbi:hypothetical protein JL720_14627 [Aureococcus anophagefferens]|nr:hypothetical protein JL720_14627 [Aureococcus anophagefferens]